MSSEPYQFITDNTICCGRFSVYMFIEVADYLFITTSDTFKLFEEHPVQSLIDFFFKSK